MEKKSPILFWGEIHIHSNLSDGKGSPMKNLRHARDVVDLDFAAITDHAKDLNQEKWKITKNSTEELNQPNNFVTLLGFEWTHPSGTAVWEPLVRKGLSISDLDFPVYGHRNIYYKEGNGEYFAWNDPESDTPDKLWDRLREQEAQSLVIPHHPASHVFPVDWEYFNPEFERLVEIYSMWGSSECSALQDNDRPIVRGGGETSESKGSHVRDALNKGCRVGIIAGSDGHDGHGGRTRHHIHNLTEHEGPFYPSGITGVYAEELTREAIWDALWDRRCFGTTGSKIQVEFSLNDHRMGSEIHQSNAPNANLKIEVHGTADVKKVELIENGSIRKTFKGNSPEFEQEVEISLPRERPLHYYVRVSQTDGELAWSSPIWID